MNDLSRRNVIYNELILHNQRNFFIHSDTINIDWDESITK